MEMSAGLTDVEGAVDEAKGADEPEEGLALAFDLAVIDVGCLGEGGVDDVEEEVGGQGSEGWGRKGRVGGVRGRGGLVVDDHGEG